VIPYVGCEYARERLDGFVDGELAVAEQVAVESHLRWCQTCVARVEDLTLIGDSLRLGSAASRADGEDARTISDLQSSVLIRVRTEEEQSFPSRFREMFADMRLLWPALGATCAVVLCVGVALSMLHSASVERPESLASMLDTLANPGAERNPLMPGNNARVEGLFLKYVDSDRAGGISLPRAVDDGSVFEAMPGQDAMFAVATVVSREGRIANYELLKSERTGQRTEKDAAIHDADLKLVLDAVQKSRFAPAQTPVGRAVAVNMVWLIVTTTVQTQDPATARVTPAVVAPASRIPPVESIAEPPVKRSGHQQLSTTA
jgi:hypothetical protein